MIRPVFKWIVVAIVIVLILCLTLWMRWTLGETVITADSNTDSRTGIFYRVVVRRIPFSRDPLTWAMDIAGVSDIGTYQVSLLFKGRIPMTSNSFRWDSVEPGTVEIKWTGLYTFSVIFDGLLVSDCRFSPWQGAQWTPRAP